MRISVTLLQYEHGIVRQVIDVLAEVVRSDRASTKKDDLRELLEFLLEYLDGFHHAKEEKHFFPYVRELFPQFSEDVDGIFHDHIEARRMMDQALVALEAERWDDLNARSLELAKHMTAHVEKEENHIFPTVEDGLPLDVDERMNEGYQGFNGSFGEDYYQKAEFFANEIQDRLLGAGFFNKGIF